MIEEAGPPPPSAADAVDRSNPKGPWSRWAGSAPRPSTGPLQGTGVSALKAMKSPRAWPCRRFPSTARAHGVLGRRGHRCAPGRPPGNDGCERGAPGAPTSRSRPLSWAAPCVPSYKMDSARPVAELRVARRSCPAIAVWYMGTSNGVWGAAELSIPEIFLFPPSSSARGPPSVGCRGSFHPPRSAVIGRGSGSHP
jgi:hypothetical protein